MVRFLQTLTTYTRAVGNLEKVQHKPKTDNVQLQSKSSVLPFLPKHWAKWATLFWVCISQL